MYDNVVEVPRLIARQIDNNLGHPIIQKMLDAFFERYGIWLKSIMLSWYRNGNDSVAWHRDRVKANVDSFVASVSTGFPRKFRIRLLSGGPTHEFSLGWGDLLVMGGSCQQTCEHTVPKAQKVGPRITIILRDAENFLL